MLSVASKSGDQAMTEAELWELMFMSVGNGTASLSVLLTITFVYLAAAYFLGSKLSNFQTVVVSTLFVFGSGVATIGFFGALMRALEFVGQLQEIHPDRYFILSDNSVLAFTVLMAAAVPVSLLFMLQIRLNSKRASERN
jgi:hypothetical protein